MSDYSKKQLQNQGLEEIQAHNEVNSNKYSNYNFGWKKDGSKLGSSSNNSFLEKEPTVQENTTAHIGTASKQGRVNYSGHTQLETKSPSSESGYSNEGSVNYGQNYYTSNHNKYSVSGQNSQSASNSQYYKNNHNLSDYNAATEIQQNANSTTSYTKGTGNVSEYMHENSIESHKFSYENSSKYAATNDSISDLSMKKHRNGYSSNPMVKGNTKYNISNNMYNRPNFRNAEVELKSQFGENYRIGSSITDDAVGDYKSNVKTVENYLSRNNIDARGMSVNDIDRALDRGQIGNVKISGNKQLTNALNELKYLKSNERAIKTGNYNNGYLRDSLNAKTSLSKEGLQENIYQNASVGNRNRMQYLSETGILGNKSSNSINPEANALKKTIEKKGSINNSDSIKLGKTITEPKSKLINAKDTVKKGGWRVVTNKNTSIKAIDQVKGLSVTDSNVSMIQPKGASRIFGNTSLGNIKLFKNIKDVKNFGFTGSIPKGFAKGQFIKGQVAKFSAIKPVNLLNSTKSFLTGAISKGAISASAIGMGAMIVFVPYFTSSSQVWIFQSGDDYTTTGYLEEGYDDPDNFAMQKGIKYAYEKQLNYEQNMINYHISTEGAIETDENGRIINDAYKDGLPSESWVMGNDTLCSKTNTTEDEFKQLYDENQERQTINAAISEDEDSPTKYMEAAVSSDAKNEDTIAGKEQKTVTEEDKGADHSDGKEAEIETNEKGYLGYNLDEYFGPISKNFKYLPGSKGSGGDPSATAPYKETNGIVNFASAKWYQPQQNIYDSHGNVVGHKNVGEKELTELGSVGKIQLYGTAGLLGDASAIDYTYGDGSTKGGHWKLVEDYSDYIGKPESQVPTNSYGIKGANVYELVNDEEENYVAIDTKSDAYKNRSYDLTEYKVQYIYTGSAYTEFENEKKYKENLDSGDPTKMDANILNYGKKKYDMESTDISYGISNNHQPDKEEYFKDSEVDLTINNDSAEARKYLIEKIEQETEEIKQRRYNVTKMYQAFNAMALGMVDQERECETFYKTFDLDLYKLVASKMNQDNFVLSTAQPITYKYNEDDVVSPRVGYYEEFEHKAGDNTTQAQIKGKKETTNCYLYFTVEPPEIADNPMTWSPTLHSENIKKNVYKITVPYSYKSNINLNIHYKRTGIQDLMYMAIHDAGDKFTSDYVHNEANHIPEAELKGSIDSFHPSHVDYRAWQENNKKGEWVGWWKKDTTKSGGDTSKSSLAQDVALSYYELTVEDWVKVMGGIWFPKDDTLKELFDWYYSGDDSEEQYYNNSSLDEYNKDNSGTWTIEHMGEGKLSDLSWGQRCYHYQIEIQSKCSRTGLCCFTSYAMCAEMAGTHFSDATLALMAEEYCRKDGWFIRQQDFMNEYGFSTSGNIYGKDIPNNIKEGIDDGKPVILHIRGYLDQQKPVCDDHRVIHPGSCQHFLLIRGYDEEGVYLADPGYKWNSQENFKVSWYDLERAGDLFIRRVYY